MGKSRSGSYKLNVVMSLLDEVVILISGLILPRLVLSYFGSSCNGLVNSITQFLGFSAVLRAGVGGATRAALYKPLADGNYDSLSGIMVATDKHMKKIGAILATGILIFSIVYPFLVLDEYEWFYSFTMVLILGTSTLVDNFFGIKYKILLQADQKYYIQIGISVISRVLSIFISAFLMISGCSIHIVKLGAALLSLLSPLLLWLYAKTHYRIDWSSKADDGALKQRWDAFFQQLAVLVNNAAPMAILTSIVSLVEVSVYSVYYMVVSNIGKVVEACTSGINSIFGNMIAKGEKEALNKAFSFSHWLVMAAATILFSVTLVMLPGFINLYTDSITDANYSRPDLAIIMILALFMKTSYAPLLHIIEAAGKFKETKRGAAIEVIINIAVSAIATIFLGVPGVMIGMFVSSLYRTVDLALYSSKSILDTSIFDIVKKYLILLATFAVCVLVGNQLLIFEMTSYLYWVINAVFVLVLSTVITGLVSILLFKDEFGYLISHLKRKGKKNA